LFVKLRRLVCADFDGENGLPALYVVAVVKESLLHFLSVDVSAVGRAKVAEETARGSDFEQAMIAREETVIRQVELRGIASTNQKSIVLVEGERAPGVWAG
jgi:hypothetical protein